MLERPPGSSSQRPFYAAAYTLQPGKRMNSFSRWNTQSGGGGAFDELCRGSNRIGRDDGSASR